MLLPLHPCPRIGPPRKKPSRRFCVQTLAMVTVGVPGTLHRLARLQSLCRVVTWSGWTSTASCPRPRRTSLSGFATPFFSAMRNMHYVSRTRDCPISTLTRCWRHIPPS
eukprot:5780156-Pyramimonas_sp.AAC.1